MLQRLVLLALVATIVSPLIEATCNIDSAGVKTYTTSDGLAVAKVGVTATFRLGCSPGTVPPMLHAETTEGQYLTVSSSSNQPEFKEVSFIEEISKSRSRWIEVKVYDDETYSKLLQARQSGSSESYYQPMKTISISHNGVSTGPYVKMETLSTLGLITIFLFAHTMRSKIVN